MFRATAIYSSYMTWYKLFHFYNKKAQAYLQNALRECIAISHRIFPLWPMGSRIRVLQLIWSWQRGTGPCRTIGGRNMLRCRSKTVRAYPAAATVRDFQASRWGNAYRNLGILSTTSSTKQLWRVTTDCISLKRGVVIVNIVCFPLFWYNSVHFLTYCTQCIIIWRPPTSYCQNTIPNFNL